MKTNILINNELLQGDSTPEKIINPVNSELIVEVPQSSERQVNKAVAADKIVAFDCHGPVALCTDKVVKADGTTPLVAGCEVVCFTDTEETAAGDSSWASANSISGTVVLSGCVGDFC